MICKHMVLFITNVLYILSSVTPITAELNLRTASSATRKTDQFLYSASASLSWTIYTKNPIIHETSDLYDIEVIMSNYFDTVLKNYRDDKSDHLVIQSEVDITGQSVSTTDTTYVLQAKVSSTYSGSKIDNYKDLLSVIMNDDNIDQLFNQLVDKGKFDMSSIAGTIVFSKVNENTESDSELLLVYNGYSKTVLIMACAVSASGILILISVFMILKYYCCESAPRKMESETDKPMDMINIDSKVKRVSYPTTITNSKTEESDDSVISHESDEVLGAKGKLIIYENATPKRATYCQDIVSNTPFSTQSSQSDLSTTSSTTSRAPLGILGFSTLNKMMLKNSPSKQKPNDSIYVIDLER